MTTIEYIRERIKQQNAKNYDTSLLRFERDVLILLNKLVEQHHEEAKQIKYMWQTLEELREQIKEKEI